MGILSTGKNTKHICLNLCAGNFVLPDSTSWLRSISYSSKSLVLFQLGLLLTAYSSCAWYKSGFSLNDDLEIRSNWAIQWKLRFKPDINKQVQEVTFWRKLQKSNHPPLTFKATSVNQFELKKHLGMFLDSKLDFKEHIQNVLNKASKTIRLLRKLQTNLARLRLINNP